MSAGRCVASITLAIVKVLPEPVTPSSTCVRSRASTPCDEVPDRGRLVAGRLEVGDHLERDAAFGLSPAAPADAAPRAGRSCAAGCRLSISAESASTVAVTPPDRQRLGVLQRNVEPGDGHQAGAGALLGRAAPPMEVPRAVLVGAEERSGIFLDLRCPSPLPSPRGASALRSASFEISSAQSEIEPPSGAPENSAWGASEKPRGCSGSAASMKSVSGLRRFGLPARSSLAAECGDFFSGDLAMVRIWRESGRMERVEAFGSRVGRTPADRGLSGGRRLAGAELPWRHDDLVTMRYRAAHEARNKDSVSNFPLPYKLAWLPRFARPSLGGENSGLAPRCGDAGGRKAERSCA